MREGGGARAQYDRGGLPGLARPRGKSAMRLVTVAKEELDLQKLHVTIMNVVIGDACQTIKNVEKIVFFRKTIFVKEDLK